MQSSSGAQNQPPKKSKLLWVGLTGGMGSGKSTAAQILRDLNCAVADADQLARQVVEPGTVGLQEVVKTFGQEILNQGQLDRHRLAEKVFQDSAKLQKLESILHPLIQVEVQKLRTQWLSEGQSMAFYDVPLLFEKNMQNQFDKIVLIDCSEETQIQRIQQRNSWTEIQIRDRLKHQIPLSEKRKKSDFVIWNEASPLDLKKDLINLLAKMNSRC